MVATFFVFDVEVLRSKEKTKIKKATEVTLN